MIHAPLMESSQCPGVHTSVQHTLTFHPQEKLFLPPLEGRGIGKKMLSSHAGLINAAAQSFDTLLTLPTENR